MYTVMKAAQIHVTQNRFFMVQMKWYSARVMNKKAKCHKSQPYVGKTSNFMQYIYQIHTDLKYIS